MFIPKETQIKERHCSARQQLTEQQAERWADETISRAGRFRTGIAGAWDWLTGKSKQIAKQNKEEAYQALKRDDKEREEQRQTQLEERRDLQDALKELKSRHSEEVSALRLRTHSQ